MAGEIFTTEELAQIAQWKQEAKDLGSSETGAFEQLYPNVRELIEAKIYVGGDEENELLPGADDEVVKTYEWLLGAAQVNSGVGPFALMINEYANRQGQLRFGAGFSTTELAAT